MTRKIEWIVNNTADPIPKKRILFTCLIWLSKWIIMFLFHNQYLINKYEVKNIAGLKIQYVGKTLRTGLEIDGDIIAKNYIVSSSVAYITSSFSSGSTIFGDSGDDTHKFTGSVLISGSLSVEGQTLFDSLNVDSASLVVSGSMRIVDQQVSSAVKSSSLFVENLGTIGNKDLAGVIDLGDGFQ